MKVNLDASMEAVFGRLAGEWKEHRNSRVSSDGRALDSYPKDSDSISLPGSTSDESE